MGCEPTTTLDGLCREAQAGREAVAGLAALSARVAAIEARLGVFEWAPAQGPRSAYGDLLVETARKQERAEIVAFLRAYGYGCAASMIECGRHREQP